MGNGITIGEILAFFAIGVLLLQYVVLIFRAKFFWKDHSNLMSEDLPLVSVLVTSRNEEIYLPRLLSSLEKLNYPQEKLEFLMADDGSSDGTFTLLNNWAASEANRKVLKIEGELIQKYPVNGKANALAILAEKALGEFYFFTDADCEVSPDWVREGVSCFDGNTGIINGITEVDSNSLLGIFQKLDWWNILAITKVISDMGGHTTGLGNNMVISRDAYLQSGGFARSSFSLTEDLEISMSIKKAGYLVRQQVSKGMFLKTKEEKNWKALMSQRKRWLQGVLTLPWIWKVSLSFHVLFFIALFYLMCLNWQIAIGIWISKIVVQSWFWTLVSSKIGSRISAVWLLLYDFYYLLASSLTILYYFWPSKITWKSRQYP
ncbi:glycosyltransferase [Algoriphagus aestuarii]|nr:glycosyltransferase [Algoriphagus aestuarii]